MTQAAILILSGLAFWLSTNSHPGRTGYAIGLLAQPLWIWETWHAAQWGMFALSLCFFIGYARGLWRLSGLKVSKTGIDGPRTTWQEIAMQQKNKIVASQMAERRRGQTPPYRNPPPHGCLSDADITDMLNRRVKVEQALFDIANGKRALPSHEGFRELALQLGSPSKIKPPPTTERIFSRYQDTH